MKNNNVIFEKKINTYPASSISMKTMNYMPVIINQGKDVQDAFVTAKKKRGLFARIFGSGISQNKVKKLIQNYQMGLVKKEDVNDYIKRYDQANANTSETITDALASIAAISAGFVIKKTGTLTNVFTTKYKTKFAMLTAGVSLLTGFISKLLFKGLDIAGMNKEGRKEQSISSTAKLGLVDGIAGYGSVVSPYLIPVGIVAGLFARYVDSKRNDSSMPSITDFWNKQKDNIIIGAASIAGVSAVAAHGHINIAKITDSIKSAAINKKHTIAYRPPEGQLTEFQQLARDIGYDLSVIIKGDNIDPKAIAKLDEDFMKILLEKGQNGNIDEKIKKLELENIFLPKYLQTVVDIPDEQQANLCRRIDQLLDGYNTRKNRTWWVGNGRDHDSSGEEFIIDRSLKEIEEKGMDINGFKDLQEILKRIKSKCSTSRTLADAQSLLDTEFGKKYTILKPCGVGSVAETYIAKDNNSGEEVIIKIVKDYFLREDKIAKDRKKILQKIKERSVPDYSWFTSKQTITSQERKKYDINKVNNMFQVWGGEINLTQEANAARAVSAQASNFQAVDVVEARHNVFIMKKAQGCQLDSNAFIKAWQSENLTESDFKSFVENYVKVYCETLFSIPKDGLKVMQSDPHCGNIFGDATKVRGVTNGTRPITIIDYGNTTQIDQTQAIKNLFNHLDYLVGNTESIAEAMLEGANLGDKNKHDVVKELAKALNETIYNPDTKIDVDNPVKIFSTVNSFCLEFMQKQNIIPNASHINQMKSEETYIISNLGCLKNIADACHYDLSKAIDRDAIIKLLISEMAKATEDAAKYNPKLTYKEIAKRYQFFIQHPEEALSCLGINFGVI